MKKLSMKNISISKKLKVGYGILLGLLLFETIVGLICIRMLDRRIYNLATKSEEANEAIKTIQIDVNTAARNVREMAMTQDTSEYSTYQSIVEEKLTDLDVQLKTIKSTGIVDSATYDSYVSLLTQWATDEYTIAATIEGGDVDAAREQIFTNCVPALDQLVESSAELDKQIEADINSSLKMSQATYYASVVIVVIMTAIGIACGLMMGSSILKAIAVPLVEIEACARELAKGNLHAELAYESGDELGTLADSIRTSISTLESYVADISQIVGKFAEGDFTVHHTVEWTGDFVDILNAFKKFEENMTETVQGMQQVAEQVESGAQQVSATSMELAQGATDQASVMQEFTSTLEDVSNQVAENADYAEGISKRVEDVGVGISATSEKMQEMVRSMNEIGESSQKIRQIIDTINDVAAQTNLLALNASIEAARAGESGRGFAVVANQVTALANQSAEAAKESTKLIEASLKEVESGMALTDEIAKQQESVAENAQLIVDEVANVAHTLKSQNESFAQLNEGIVQINDVIQTNSATSEECAASSQEMSGQASILDGLVRGFKVAASV
jgi:methyl-accepting chemotaxis protein